MVLAPPHKDLERRRPVWNALSDLYLDNQLFPDDLHYIARVLAESSYSILDLSEILRTELHPILRLNLSSVAGVWAGFDQHWLEEEILKNASRKRSWWRRCFGDPIFGLGLVDKHWQEIMRTVHQLRTGQDHAESGG